VGVRVWAVRRLKKGPDRPVWGNRVGCCVSCEAGVRRPLFCALLGRGLLSGGIAGLVCKPAPKAG
jgi:hypothetical protein